MSNSVKRVVKKIINTNSAVTAQLALIASSTLEINQKIEVLNDHLLKLNYTNNSNRSTTFQTGQNEIVTKLFNGQKIYLSLDDLSLTPHVVLDGIWESEITHAWRSLIRPSSIVFDIGANFGYYGLVASQLLDMKNSKVVYFEPNIELTPLIRKSLALNWLVENSSVETVAVSDKVGMAKLTVLRDYIGSSSLHSLERLTEYLGDTMDLVSERIVEVPTITIDNYCEQHKIDKLDLVKLDVEGYEDFAYSGMRKTVKKSSDLILFVEFTAKSYAEPEKFYETIKNDFGYVWVIEADGILKKVNDLNYKEIEKMSTDWIMLVFSKKIITQKL